MNAMEALQWDERLHDGTDVHIRPITASDVDQERWFFDDLSPESRHARFLGGIAHLNDKELQRLCNVDYKGDMAFIALAFDKLLQVQIGVARYAEDARGDHEIAVTVADKWQHKGAGSLLLQHLIDYAATHGAKRLYSLDSPYNDDMRRLVEEFGFARMPDPRNPRQVLYELNIG